MDQHVMPLRRNNTIVVGKFRKYLIPCLLTAIAVSLDEFADSLIVSHLIGAEAMSIVNISFPVSLILCAIYILFGSGGSTIYASLVGERKKEQAGKICTLSMIAAIALSFLVTLVGFLFLDPICHLLCPDETIYAVLRNYVTFLLYSAPLTVGIFTLSNFFAAAGNPGITTAISIIANVINLVMDYIYIGVMGFGVEGAALASITGYIIGIIFLVTVFIRKKTYLHFEKIKITDIKKVFEIMAQGSANAVGQIGWSVKFAFCNNIALVMGGVEAMNVFSVCIQLLSIVSIAMSGIMDSFTPILAVLKGQKDYRGMWYMVKAGFLYFLGSSVIITVIFEMFPKLLLAMFNVTNPASISMGITAIRIFSTMFIFRCIYLLLMIVVRISGRKLYAFLIGLFDGVIAIVLIGLLLTKILGLTGLWYTFPVASGIILLATWVYDMILAKGSNGNLHGYFLMESIPDDIYLKDITINSTDTKISALSEQLIHFCKGKNVDAGISYQVGLIAEEMAVYTKNHAEKNEIIDITTKIYPDQICVDFRSDGIPFNPMVRDEKDTDENYKVLQGLPCTIKYDYILGMNCTQFIFQCK